MLFGGRARSYKIPNLRTTLWNSADKGAAITLSGGSLIATKASGASDQLVRADKSSSTGLLYFEITVTTAGSGPNVIGIGTSGESVNTYVGKTAASWGAAQSSLNFLHIDVSTGAVSYTTGDIIGVAVNFTTSKLWFSKNGVWNTGDPAADTSPTFSSVSGTLFPMASMSTTGAAVTANFGATAFSYTKPSGFSSWNNGS